MPISSERMKNGPRLRPNTARLVLITRPSSQRAAPPLKVSCVMTIPSTPSRPRRHLKASGSAWQLEVGRAKWRPVHAWDSRARFHTACFTRCVGLIENLHHVVDLHALFRDAQGV